MSAPAVLILVAAAPFVAAAPPKEKRLGPLLAELNSPPAGAAVPLPPKSDPPAGGLAPKRPPVGAAPKSEVEGFAYVVFPKSDVDFVSSFASVVAG